MTKNSDDFFKALAKRESSDNYKAINSSGYLGLYQMGEQAMVDAGYYYPKEKYNNKWDGKFTGKDGIYSKEDFLNNRVAQEKAQRIFKRKQWNYIKQLHKYVGKNINGTTVTQSGMLGVAHLLGQSNLAIYLQSNGNIIPKDGNGTTADEYMKLLGGYDVSDITGEKPQQQKTKKFPYYNPIVNFHNRYSIPIGYAASIQNSSAQHTFTPDEIGAMTPEEFSQNEAEIMKQVQQGQVKNEAPKIDYSNYQNPQTGKPMIYTREDIGNMSTEEFTQHEKAINAQLQAIGIPNKSEVPSNIQTHTPQKAANGNGRWVTINGNHVFIEE